MFCMYFVDFISKSKKKRYLFEHVCFHYTVLADYLHQVITYSRLNRLHNRRQINYTELQCLSLRIKPFSYSKIDDFDRILNY